MSELEALLQINKDLGRAEEDIEGLAVLYKALKKQLDNLEAEVLRRLDGVEAHLKTLSNRD